MTDEQAKPKRISKKIMAAIDAMAHGDIGTITAAAEKAGCSREYLPPALWTCSPLPCRS
ncbi:transposase [Bradyrhizobium sp. USDA 4448]